VKDKQSQFCRKEPLGALAPITESIPAAALFLTIVRAIMRVAENERVA